MLEPKSTEASLAVAQGAFQDTDAALARAEGRLNGSPYWETGARTLLVRGELSFARSRFGSAVEEFALALETSVQSGFKDLEILAQIELGQTLTSLGGLRDPRMSLDEAMETSKRLGFQPLRAMAALAISQLYVMSGDFESAVRASTDALGVAKAMSLKPIVFGSCVTLGDALFSMGRSQKAGAAYREAHQVHYSLLASMAPAHRQVYRDNPEIGERLRTNIGLLDVTGTPGNRRRIHSSTTLTFNRGRRSRPTRRYQFTRHRGLDTTAQTSYSRSLKG